jgi:predicted transposase YdaD
LLDNELTREAVDYMKRAAYTKEELEVYDKWKINIMTERGAIYDARKEGRVEERLEIAKELKTLGISFDQISIATKLSIKEIEKI